MVSCHFVALAFRQIAKVIFSCVITSVNDKFKRKIYTFFFSITRSLYLGMYREMDIIMLPAALYLTLRTRVCSNITTLGCECGSWIARKLILRFLIILYTYELYVRIIKWNESGTLFLFCIRLLFLFCLMSVCSSVCVLSEK